MIDDLFTKNPRRHIKDLNIVPILDMLTTVIFFLLMSTSFMEFTKLTVPPSRTSVSTATDDKPPVAPKLLLTEREGGLRMLLIWGGVKPGERQEKIEATAATNPDERRKAILDLGRKMVGDFAKDFPDEKTLQLGLGNRVPYQDLISTMDAAQEKIKDIVLISNNEAEARSR